MLRDEAISARLPLPVPAMIFPPWGCGATAGQMLAGVHLLGDGRVVGVRKDRIDALAVLVFQQLIELFIKIVTTDVPGNVASSLPPRVDPVD